MPDSVTQVRAAGPVGAKRNLAILGDGFASGDQATYDGWVDNTLLAGVFGRDYFYEDASAWNIFRVNLISNESGVSTRVYDEHGTPSDPSDDTIVSTTILDTALGMIFSGSGAHCWMGVRRQHGESDPDGAEQVGAGLQLRADCAQHCELRGLRG